MAVMDQLQFFGGRKNLVINYSNFTITFPTIWRYACDFFKVLRKFKIAAMHELQIFFGTINSKIYVRNNVQVILLKFKMATTSRLL